MVKEDDRFNGVMFFLYGVIAGLVVVLLIVSNMNNESVDAQVLEESCKKIYGSNYEWVDQGKTVMHELVCAIPQVKHVTDNAALIVKLN